MIVKLNYPYTFFGITISIPRRIGFMFTNLHMFNFRENTGIIDSKEMDQWVKKNGNQAMINEMVYGAAQAYCMIEKKKENFTKEKLIRAIAISSQQAQAKIMKAWEDSTDKTISDKKKAKK